METFCYAIGFIPDIRRVFAYHEVEHETINAYEGGAPLEPDAIKAYSTAHERCATGFTLLFAVIAILVFSLFGRPTLVLRILSRLVLIPVIAEVAITALQHLLGMEEEGMRG